MNISFPQIGFCEFFCAQIYYDVAYIPPAVYLHIIDELWQRKLISFCPTCILKFLYAFYVRRSKTFYFYYVEETKILELYQFCFSIYEFLIRNNLIDWNAEVDSTFDFYHDLVVAASDHPIFDEKAFLERNSSRYPWLKYLPKENWPNDDRMTVWKGFLLSSVDFLETICRRDSYNLTAAIIYLFSSYHK